MKQTYSTEQAEKLKQTLGIKNPMRMPVLKKIVVNMGVKDAVSDKKNIERAVDALVKITGQKPKITTARLSIASFKLREGDAIGVMVTLRGKRMHDFFGKLVSVVLPRLRDFHGVPRKSFDSRGNYTLGFSEFSVFPEIDPGEVERVQGLEVCIVTSAQNSKEGLAFLEALGMPFQKEK